MLDFIISINKISLIAFLVTLGYLIYELYLLKKEQKRKKIPTLPQFKETAVPELINSTMITVKKNETKPTEKDSKIFLILIIFLIFFAILTLIGFFYRSKLKKEANNLVSPVPTIIEKRVESSGVFVYDENFRLLKENDLEKLSSGSSIIIGIKTIPQADIDKARIRVNKNYWDITDITSKFDKNNQIFYINYKIVSNEQRLKIEAQLHSRTEGWLGE